MLPRTIYNICRFIIPTFLLFWKSFLKRINSFWWHWKIIQTFNNPSTSTYRVNCKIIIRVAGWPTSSPWPQNYVEKFRGDLKPRPLVYRSKYLFHNNYCFYFQIQWWMWQIVTMVKQIFDSIIAASKLPGTWRMFEGIS